MAPPPAAPAAAKPKLTLAAFNALMNPDAAKNDNAKVAPPSISAAPVIYTKEEQEAKEKEASKDADKTEKSKLPPLNRAALIFKPRDKIGDPAYTKESAPAPEPQEPRPANATKKRTYEDWVALGKDDDYYSELHAQQRARGGRKNKKQKQIDQLDEEARSDWSAPYVLTLPNLRGKRGEKWKTSAEFDKVRADWRAELGRPAHPPRSRGDDAAPNHEAFRGFAPPEFYDAEDASKAHKSPQPPPSATVPTDATGEDAYLRRMAMSQGGAQLQPPVQAAVTTSMPEASAQHIAPHEAPQSAKSENALPRESRGVFPPLSSSRDNQEQRSGLGSRDDSDAIARSGHAESGPVQFRRSANSSTISAAPVFYNLPQPSPKEQKATSPPTDSEVRDNPADDEPRSKRPGQHGFGERMMAKMGWKKGQGLGATGSGIISPLSVKLEKNKHHQSSRGRSDDHFRGPAGTGRIVGGKISKEAQAALDEEKAKGPGKLSSVVVLQGITRGRNLDEELSDGSFVQKLGDKCTEEFGNVERIHVDRAQDNGQDGAPVFIKFNAEMSALRAVQKLSKEAYEGNQVRARYFDAAKFERREYDLG